MCIKAKVSKEIGIGRIKNVSNFQFYTGRIRTGQKNFYNRNLWKGTVPTS